MVSLPLLRRRVRDHLRPIYSFLPVQGISRPVFLIGCGRSGKSTLAKRLVGHREIVYLNEPRHLWAAAFPQSDIWSAKALQRAGKLVLDENDFEPSKARRLARLFRFETRVRPGATLVEELAINNFRLKFIKRSFPDARFIHIYRDGLEVAELIEEKANTGRWFGVGNYKWNQLVDYAARTETTSRLPALCKSLRDKGLLEWRLGTEAVVSFLSTMPREAYLEINSNTLIRDPSSVVATVCRFLEIETPAIASGSGRDVNVIAQGSRSRRAMSARDSAIGGPLLPLSISTSHDLTLRAIENETITSGER